MDDEMYEINKNTRGHPGMGSKDACREGKSNGFNSTF